MESIKKTDGIVVNIEGYSKPMLKDYGIKSANGVITLLPKDAYLYTALENETLLNTAEHKKYLSLTGSLLYLAACTRPDTFFLLMFLLAKYVHQLFGICSRKRAFCLAWCIIS